MATLIFSTVGTLLGGPVGGAIGALIGQSIDQELLGPRGPKLGDLKVQTSDYGTQLPRIYGRMRIAGSVIWATDLAVSEQTSGAKGQSNAVTSYSVSFAVALSSRPAMSVGRIWADGKLLRGADGDFKVSTDFRFHDGSEDQIVDPLIASIEGIDATPAYRGVALAVFENLELAEYGNRIPFLTFELVADDEAPAIGAILGDSSGGAAAVETSSTVVGYAAYGATIRAAIKPLVEAHGIELFDDGLSVRAAAGGAAVTVAENDLGNSADSDVAPRFEREMAPARALPAALRLSYYDPARDYQSAEARASAGEQAGGEERRELAAVMEAGDAKSLAHQMIARAWAARDRLTLRLPPRFIFAEPGSRMMVDLSPALWTVEKITIDGFVASAELKPWWQPSPALAGDPGRVLSSPDLIAAPATLALVEVPSDDGADSASSGSTFMLAASSPSPAWRSQSVTVSVGEREYASATPRRKSLLGTAETALGDGQPYLLDGAAQVTVALLDPDQWLESRDNDALAAGANLAMIGKELVQFASAMPLGGGRFLLSGLLRGRGGSEWAMGAHMAGEIFVLLDPARLARIELPASAVGATVQSRIDWPEAIVSDAVVVSGEKLRPPSPVRLAAGLVANGDLALSWVRRSRDGFSWTDEIDAPLGEASEAYRVTVTAGAGSATFECDSPQLLINAAELAPLGSGPAMIIVRQLGDRALSRPASLSITLA